MNELKSAQRLAKALQNCTGGALVVIAHYLNYDVEELAEDINAINKYVDKGGNENDEA